MERVRVTVALAKKQPYCFICQEELEVGLSVWQDEATERLVHASHSSTIRNANCRAIFIARFALEHPELTVNELANYYQVSTRTVLRGCRLLGVR